ncbi:PP2C family protein-serine/threonine phosphatase [Rhodovibrio salinarum]|nr:protein phosphatase 2C domain-containing protein [Rhodovibrio salinarum]
MRAVVHAVVHRGAVRSGNEDTLAVGDWVAPDDIERPKRFTHELTTPLPVIVADGMGGHAAGDVASRYVTETILQGAADVQGAGDAGNLLLHVNRRLYEAMAQGLGASGMGTTVAGVILREIGAVVFNVGDSRIYRMDPGARALTQLSVDDTPGPKMANGRTAQQITPMVSQSLGGQPSYTAIEPHAEDDAPPVDGTCYLVCSDGLSDLLSAGEIEEILARADDDEGDFCAVDRLFQAALDRGGKDNVTIALVRCLA